jgi:hypothetical protein
MDTDRTHLIHLLDCVLNKDLDPLMEKLKKWTEERDAMYEAIRERTREREKKEETERSLKRKQIPLRMELDTYNRSRLIEICKEYDVSTRGTKRDMVDRLCLY